MVDFPLIICPHNGPLYTASKKRLTYCPNVLYCRYMLNPNKGGTMATKDTQYKFYATVTMPTGKVRHLFTNDTVSRTKTLLKNGVNMDSVKWIALESPMTKAQVFASVKENFTADAPAQAVAG